MFRRGLLVMLSVALVAAFSLTALASPEDGVLVFGATGELRTLDPHVSVDNNAWRAIYYCYDRLVEFKL
ncbi:ABC transporter substrate-binding protein, partial [Candidatus Bipolaricaulota bacterium]|nr:ABC transporter substrate-binding protein [Candidatus Bipolaricaulota bacterium]